MIAKRLFDVTLALIALLLFSPAYLLIAILVKLDTPGPVLYKARRVGQSGKIFHMFKFRTMVVGADRSGPPLTYYDDPRITRTGRFLRNTRLDELPQFLNVLKGDMSIVGPRPEDPTYVDYRDPLWRQILVFRPGICGLAQLTFAFDEAALLNSQATASRDYISRILPTKLALDLQYINQQSLVLDLHLLLQTLFAVIRRN